MKRATTPRHSFSFDVDPDATFEEILIIYAQNGKVILEKHKEDLTFDPPTDCGQCGAQEWTAWLRLTQAETNMFSATPTVRGGKRAQVELQVRVLSYAKDALASEIKTVSLTDVLDDQILGVTENGDEGDAEP